MSKLAYYAHSHGSGHCRYADYVSSLIPGGITVMTTPEYPFQHARRVVALPSEDVADAERSRHLIDVPDYLHYSPVDRESILRRSIRILDTVEREKIDLVIVDVSVEVAALLRASSVPYLYVKMPGHRNDLPHLAAYRGAMGLVAYYPRELEGPETPEWVMEKTAYLGFKPPVGSYAGEADITVPGNKPMVCLVKGFGGGQEVDRAARQLRRHHPDMFLTGLGDFSDIDTHIFDVQPGIVSDIRPYLNRADVVIGACGSNLTAEVIHLGKAFVCLPCTRPFDEQEATAAALKRHGLAIGLDDYLSGVRPPAPDHPLRAHFTRNRFGEYFRRLTAAADWREVLKPHLMPQSIPHHASAL